MLRPIRLLEDEAELAYQLENFGVPLLKKSLLHPPILKAAMKRCGRVVFDGSTFSFAAAGLLLGN
jgi:hypothetical protein